MVPVMVQKSITFIHDAQRVISAEFLDDVHTSSLHPARAHRGLRAHPGWEDAELTAGVEQEIHPVMRDVLRCCSVGCGWTFRLKVQVEKCVQEQKSTAGGILEMKLK